MRAAFVVGQDGADLVPSISVEALLLKRQAIAERAQAIERSRVEIDDLYRSIIAGGIADNARFSGAPDVFLDNHGSRSDFTAAQHLKLVDAALWAHLLHESGLRTFMDAITRGEWDGLIRDLKVPELTRENIEATFRAMYAGRGEMFEQGVIRLVRSLSWDYKTNLPHKFGKRLILTRAVSTYKHGSRVSLFGVDHAAANKLDDLIRVLSVVDGKPEPDHRSGSWSQLSAARWMHEAPLIQDAELPYLSLRGFKNGNAHVTFAPTAKVDALNKIIAKHFPKALPPAREAA